MQSPLLNTDSHNSLVHDSESPYLRSLRDENDLIEMYLNQQVFYHRSTQKTDQIYEANFANHQEKSQTASPISDQSSPQPQIPVKHKKSLFHNFQKHLITIIKKYMSIAKSRIVIIEDGLIAYELWQAFTKTNSFNKRLLHIVFGVEEEKSQKDSISRLSAEFPEFQRVSSRHHHQRILSAQAIIRHSIVQQAAQLSKFFLKSNSSITKFDQFYGYYSNFIKELENGSMSKRLSKTSKQNLINNFKAKRVHAQ